MECQKRIGLSVLFLLFMAFHFPGLQTENLKIGLVLTQNCSLISCTTMINDNDSTLYLQFEEVNVTLIRTVINPYKVFHLFKYLKQSILEDFAFILIDESLKPLLNLLPVDLRTQVIPVPFTSSLVSPTVAPISVSACSMCGPDSFYVIRRHDSDATTCVHGGLRRSTMRKTLTEVIRHLMWKELILIYDRVYETDAKVLTSSLKNTQLMMFRVDDMTDSQNSTKTFSSEDTVQNVGNDSDSYDVKAILDIAYNSVHIDSDVFILVLCSTDCIKNVFLQANQFDDHNAKRTALHMRSQWLVALPEDVEEETIKNFFESLDNLDNVAFVGSKKLRTVETALDFNENIENWIREGIDSLQERNETVTASTLKSTLLQLLHTSQTECTDNYVRTLYFGTDKARFLNDVAMVTSSHEIILLGNNDIFPNTKFGLNKRTLTVATEEWAPFVVGKEDDGKTVYFGFCIDILRQMELSLNFTSKLVSSPDGEWGLNTHNRSYTGLIGQLQRHEVDLVVAPLAIHAEREEVMDFTVPFYIDYTTVLLKMPDPNESKWLTLIQPFKWKVHLTLWMSLFFVSAFGTLLERWNPFYSNREEKSALHGLSDCFWYMYGALLTQGGEKLPMSTTGRTLVSCWWLFSIIVASTYGGNLIAFLTVSKDTAPFDSLESMLNQDRYKWGIVGGTVFELFFEPQFQRQEMILQQATDPILKALWKNIVDFNNSDPSVLASAPRQHLEKVKRGDYAYIGDKSMIDLWMQEECDLIKIKEKLYPLQYAIGLVNDSAYTRMFSDEIIRLSELGLLYMWATRWWQKTNFCDGPLITEAKAISLLDVQSAFYMVGIGIVTSTLILALENLRRCIVEYRNKAKQEREPDPEADGNGDTPEADVSSGELHRSGDVDLSGDFTVTDLGHDFINSDRFERLSYKEDGTASCDSGVDRYSNSSDSSEIKHPEVMVDKYRTYSYL